MTEVYSSKIIPIFHRQVFIDAKKRHPKLYFTTKQKKFFESGVSNNHSRDRTLAKDTCARTIELIDYLFNHSNFLESGEDKWIRDVFNTQTLESILQNILMESKGVEKQFKHDFKTTELVRLMFEISREYLIDATKTETIIADLKRISDYFITQSESKLDNETYAEHGNEKHRILTRSQEQRFLELKKKSKLKKEEQKEFKVLHKHILQKYDHLLLYYCKKKFLPQFLHDMILKNNAKPEHVGDTELSIKPTPKKPEGEDFTLTPMYSERDFNKFRITPEYYYALIKNSNNIIWRGYEPGISLSRIKEYWFLDEKFNYFHKNYIIKSKRR